MIGQSDKQAQGGEGFPKIGSPATRALHAAGYTHLEQLTEVSEAELLKLHGMGPKALSILRDALAERSMSFASQDKQEP